MRLTTLSFAALVVAGIPAVALGQDFSKAEVKAEVLAPGVAVLFGVGGNIGVSYGPDGTALIDDQFAPLTDKIAAAVAALGATPVRLLVNTHWHGDHSGGNENFGKAGAVILAHDNVRIRLAQGGKGGNGATVPPAPAAALPVVTYDTGLKLHLNGDDIEAIYTGGGHTDGDTALYWRKANILHTGDLMMNKAPFPFIDVSSGGNAMHLVASLDQLIKLTNPQTRVIPGHGPVGTQADLIAWRDRIASGVETVRKARAKKQTLEAFLAANPLKAYDQPGAFIDANAFATAVWASLDAISASGHKHH